MGGPRHADIAHELDHGTAVIIQSRLLRARCEATGTRSRRLAHDFLRAYPARGLPLLRGASEGVGVHGQPSREVWRHQPTGDRWVVITDRRGIPTSAAGPFSRSTWDPLLRDYVIVDGHHALDWLREHLDEFAREDADQA